VNRVRRPRAGPLPTVDFAHGVHLPGTPLWCDATRPVELCFISHAHSDHLARHQRMIATERTRRLCEHRLGQISALASPYRRPFALGRLELELFPAGHVLGSAQLRVRTDQGDLVYTGDLNLEASRTAERAQVVPCDVLVIEATYGHPRFVFPPRAQVEARVVDFVVRCLEAEVTPVLYAHPLGKAQELCALLGEAGISSRVHGAIYDICRIYGECGVSLPRVKRFQGTPAKNEAVVFPFHLQGSRAIRALKRARTAAVTGWALDPRARTRSRTDEAFPLSDHADHPSLLRYVELARPVRVYTVFGFAEELARTLRQQGIEASPLVPPRQMELFP
jgi:putative mRNA 3-end processing factor